MVTDRHVGDLYVFRQVECQNTDFKRRFWIPEDYSYMFQGNNMTFSKNL